jgi:hypothetical protein
MNFLFLSYLAIICFQLQVRPPVSFTEEYLEFRLRETTFTVNGNYYFVNNTVNAVSKEINYPFPVALSNIDSIHIFDNAKGRFLEFKKLRQAVVFRLSLMPNDTVNLNIFYEQKGVGDTIKYILTTTRNWGEPLKKAEYTFETEQYRNIKTFSYTPDKTIIHNHQKKYFWHRKDFLPEKDFIVIFGN